VGDAAHPEDLSGEGVQGGGVGEGGSHGRGGVEKQEGVGVWATVAVEAIGVGVRGDARKSDGAVVRRVGLVGAEHRGDVGLKGRCSGGEGVVHVGREATAAGGEVDRVED